MTGHPYFVNEAKSTRNLDRLYLDRPPATNYRPYFRFVLDRVLEGLKDVETPTLLDIGCANGAFIHYMLSELPRLSCTGIDALPELIAMANVAVPRALFAVGDIQDASTLPTETSTVVTLLTLHSHFDCLDSWLDNVLSLVEPGGRAMLFGPFNPIGVDVLVRLRKSSPAGSEWMPGWNMHSQWSFANYLNKRGLSFVFHPYIPASDLNEDELDPLRTRLATLNNNLVLTNGAGLILSFALLEISI